MSAIIGGALAGFIALLLANGFSSITQKVFGDTTVLSGKNKDGKPFQVTIQNEALKSPQFDLIDLPAGVAVTKKPTIPQFEIKNTSSTVKKIFTIAIIPDAAMRTDGVMEIFLNESRLFPITDPVPGMFKGITALNIPIPPNFGLKIDESKKLEVFIWTPNAVAVQSTFAVFIANQV